MRSGKLLPTFGSAIALLAPIILGLIATAVDRNWSLYDWATDGLLLLVGSLALCWWMLVRIARRPKPPGAKPK